MAKQQVHWAGHSLAFTAKVENEWASMSSPSLFLHGMQRGSLFIRHITDRQQTNVWRNGPCLLPGLMLLMWKEQVF
jgi:hypothetical protein